MDDYNKIIKLTNNSTVELGSSFKDFLHTHLQFGQSRWVCRYGTLSDGHEKITPAQRYYQAIKEMFIRSREVKNLRVSAMKAQADLIDAEEKLSKQETVESLSETLRVQADILDAKTRLENTLMNIEDTMRQIDEFNKVREELKQEVETKYPGGIEEAEKDNWEAVYKYRMIKSQTRGFERELTSNIPLPQELKAELGAKWQRLDSIAPLAVTNESKAEELISKNIRPQTNKIGVVNG